MVPFFGDQSFWGAACYRMGVGPPPLPIDKLTTEGLIEALEFMRKPEAQEAARKAAANIAKVRPLQCRRIVLPCLHDQAQHVLFL